MESVMLINPKPRPNPRPESTGTGGREAEHALERLEHVYGACQLEVLEVCCVIRENGEPTGESRSIYVIPRSGWLFAVEVTRQLSMYLPRQQHLNGGVRVHLTSGHVSRPREYNTSPA